jgi:hypothetical protein
MLVLALAFAAASGGDSSDNEEGLAAIACQNLVKDNLRAPSTASFPSFPTVSGDTIRGAVDAENGFGAMIRSDFQCTIIGGSQVRLDFLG